jgi:hypothetical protein
MQDREGGSHEFVCREARSEGAGRAGREAFSSMQEPRAPERQRRVRIGSCSGEDRNT